MKLNYDNDAKIFYLSSTYEEKEKAKNSGFRWNALYKQWESNNIANVKKALAICEEKEEKIENIIAELEIKQDKEKEEKEKQKAIILEKTSRYEATYREILLYDYTRICHYKNSRIVIYTQYEDKINDKLWQKFQARWNKTERAREIKPIEISKVFDFCNANEFVITKEFIEAKTRIGKEKEKKIAESKATASNISIPAPTGLSYLPFQKAGIDFAEKRQGRVLLADEMGLGKTIQTLGWLNLHQHDAFPVLIICPAVMKLVWKNEIEKWLIAQKKIYILQGKNGNKVKEDVIITNYDIVEANKESLKTKNFQTVILDESHYIKNYKAKRTLATIELAKNVKYLFCLSGTPFLNKPIEGWTTLNLLSPNTFPKYWDYTKKYCAAHQTRFGWDLSGASNLNELQEKLRTSIMIRRLKKDVLTELPAKRRTLIPIEVNDGDKESETFLKRLKNIMINRKEAEKKEMTETEKQSYFSQLREENSGILAEIEKLKQKAVEKKLPFAIEYIKNIIEEKKLVVFAHHKFVIKKLLQEFPQAVCIKGESSEKERTEAIEKFQTNKDCNLFIGSMHACGVGITLSASSDVVFLEFDWTPATHLQAEDRCHRIGQKDSVNIYYLALNNSIDIRIAKILERKSNILEQILDETEKGEILNQSIFDELIKEEVI